MTPNELMLAESARLSQICTTLVLQPDKVKQYPHARRVGRVEFNQDVIATIVRDTGGLDGVTARKRARASRAAAHAKRLRTHRKYGERRKAELQEALAKMGCELRSDSSLCAGYIDGTLRDHWTLEQIAREMARCKYLYEFCPEFTAELARLDDAVEAEVDELSNGGRRYYRGIYDDAIMNATLCHNRSEMVDDLKSKFAIPATWPWM